ncbi:MAG: FkbM family methyltransferase [Alphaproteobacteria bacterium]|nr:FkbM family methyltransferase [Alphaproteobacteria bacterium]
MKRRDDLDVASAFGVRRPDFLPKLIWQLATHRKIDRKHRKFIRKRIARRFPGPFDVTVEGVSLRAYPLENYCDRTAVGRGRLPEIPERKLIAPLLHPKMVFVDIGANIGTYSLFVAKSCQDDATILSFEPHPRTFAKLVFNTQANHFDSIETINQGVGPQREHMRLYSDGGTNIGTASILPDAAGNKESVDIEIVPLTDVLKHRFIDHIDLLKIDIEGYEDQALMPLMQPEHQSLWPRAILIETVLKQHWQSDCIAHLQTLGYQLAGDTGENMLFSHPMTEKLES